MQLIVRRKVYGKLCGNFIKNNVFNSLMEAILLQKPKEQKELAEDELFVKLVRGLEDARLGRIRRWKESDF